MAVHLKVGPLLRHLFALNEAGVDRAPETQLATHATNLIVE